LQKKRQDQLSAGFSLSCVEEVTFLTSFTDVLGPLQKKLIFTLLDLGHRNVMMGCLIQKAVLVQFYLQNKIGQK
jgi:hypothetical protein